jgi:hypothetical protein
MLERGLAVEPSPATRAEYEALLRQAAAPAAAFTARRASALAPVRVPVQVSPAPPNNLRLALTSFVGREREIREVKSGLLSARLLTLTGAGGSGKTRLALETAMLLLWCLAADNAAAGLAK